MKKVQTGGGVCVGKLVRERRAVRYTAGEENTPGYDLGPYSYLSYDMQSRETRWRPVPGVPRR